MGRFSRRIESKNMRVSVRMASRSSGPHSGNLSGSGFMESRLRSSSHCPAKFSASAPDLASASMRFICACRVLRIAQFAGFRQPEEFVVRHGTPEEIAEPRSQFDIAYAANGRSIARVAFDAEEEVGGNEHRLNRGRDSLLQGQTFPLSRRNQIAQGRHVLLRHRPAVGAVRQSGKDTVDTGLPGIGIADQDCLAPGGRPPPPAPAPEIRSVGDTCWPSD